jgi:hypothetical protein
MGIRRPAAHNHAAQFYISYRRQKAMANKHENTMESYTIIKIGMWFLGTKENMLQ